MEICVPRSIWKQSPPAAERRQHTIKLKLMRSAAKNLWIATQSCQQRYAQCLLLNTRLKVAFRGAVK